MSEQKFLIKGGFFNSINGDRKYNSEEMNKPYKRIITEGIFATQQGTPSTDLQVLSADDGMNIIVKTGDGLLGGKWFENTADIPITVSANTSIVPRIDSIIIQIDNTQSGRVPNVIYREGIASSNPQPPEVNNVENIIERRIANIRVNPDTNKIGQELITDLRGSSECPWITSLIKQVDTSTLFLQWQTAYKNYYDKSTTEFNTFYDESTETFQNFYNTSTENFEDFYNTSTEDFENWFNNVKDKLSSNVIPALPEWEGEEREYDQSQILYCVMKELSQEAYDDIPEKQKDVLYCIVEE